MKELYKNNPELAADKWKKIRCIETQKIYNSIKEASETMHISRGNISAVLHERRKHANGFTFEFI